MEFGRLRYMLQKGCFALILLVFGGVCSWPTVAMQTPYGKHQWRQCDAYSMALNYYEEEAGFFEPRMHFQHGNGLGSGRSVGEFPVTYWFNAKLWNGIGLKPHTMRWTHMLLWILGCLAIFRLGREWFGPGKSAFATTFVMASPLIAFYSASYLVNVAGLAMVFIGWRLAWQIFGQDRFRWGTELMLFMVLSCSVLFRPTMVLGWIPIAIWALHQGQWKPWVLRLSAPLGMGLLWVLWAKSVNAAAGSVYYLTSIRPVWAAQNSDELWRAFREDVLPEWYHKYVLGILVAVVLVLAVQASFSSADSVKETTERKTKDLHLPAMIRADGARAGAVFFPLVREFGRSRLLPHRIPIDCALGSLVVHPAVGAASSPEWAFESYRLVTINCGSVIPIVRSSFADSNEICASQGMVVRGYSDATGSGPLELVSLGPRNAIGKLRTTQISDA